MLPTSEFSPSSELEPSNSDVRVSGCNTIQVSNLISYNEEGYLKEKDSSAKKRTSDSNKHPLLESGFLEPYTNKRRKIEAFLADFPPNILKASHSNFAVDSPEAVSSNLNPTESFTSITSTDIQRQNSKTTNSFQLKNKSEELLSETNKHKNDHSLLESKQSNKTDENRENSNKTETSRHNKPEILSEGKQSNKTDENWNKSDKEDTNNRNDDESFPQIKKSNEPHESKSKLNKIETNNNNGEKDSESKQSYKTDENNIKIDKDETSKHNNDKNLPGSKQSNKPNENMSKSNKYKTSKHNEMISGSMQSHKTDGNNNIMYNDKTRNNHNDEIRPGGKQSNKTDESRSKSVSDSQSKTSKTHSDHSSTLLDCLSYLNKTEPLTLISSDTQRKNLSKPNYFQLKYKPLDTVSETSKHNDERLSKSNQSGKADKNMNKSNKDETRTQNKGELFPHSTQSNKTDEINNKSNKSETGIHNNGKVLLKGKEINNTDENMNKSNKDVFINNVLNKALHELYNTSKNVIEEQISMLECQLIAAEYQVEMINERVGTIPEKYEKHALYLCGKAQMIRDYIDKLKTQYKINAQRMELSLTQKPFDALNDISLYNLEILYHIALTKDFVDLVSDLTTFTESNMKVLLHCIQILTDYTNMFTWHEYRFENHLDNLHECLEIIAETSKISDKKNYKNLS